METGVITRIERQKSGAPRYNIHIDGMFRFAVHEDVLVRFALSKGMRVNLEEIEGILEAEEVNKVRRAALRYLGYKPRTVLEVERHLIGKGFDPAHSRDVIEKMRSQGYLDDRRFARDWVEQRRAGKGYGRRMLQRELEQKGVPAEVIEEALVPLDEEEEARLAYRVAEKRYRRLKGESWETVERRLGQYLLRRGFQSSLVIEVLQELNKRSASTGEEEG